MQIVLASASPSRKKLLESVGIAPQIIVSGVDEELPEITSLKPAEMVIALAIMKAQTVAQKLNGNYLVIGCDSTFEFEGVSLGKPGNAENAIQRSNLVSGKSGLLHTGICVIDVAKSQEYSDLSTSLVKFSKMDQSEIHNYVASGEPLNVAGGFTLDGYSAPFIERIDGDPSGIIGLPLYTLRLAVKSLGYKWEELVIYSKVAS